MEALQSVNVVEVVELVERVQEIPRLRRPKIYHPRNDPFSLGDVEFKRRYRFEKSTISFIVDLVRTDLIKGPRGGGITPELQVLTAIRCWGRREVQDDAGQLHGLSQATVSRVCARVARALAQYSSQFIKMPASLAEEQRVTQGFYDIRRFPNVVGCIDCTHIRIRKHGGDTAQYFINRKGFYSLNVQVTCDAQLRIMDIVARWRGSTHDARIFSESSLKERFERGEFRGRLLGDSGYKLESYLFTPVLRPLTQAEQVYNQAHIATRNTIERCFGVWKQRFQCLLHGLTVGMKNIKPTIVALAVLHNIAIDHRDSILDEHILPDGTFEAPQSDHSHASVASRTRGANNALLRAFIQRHFD